MKKILLVDDSALMRSVLGDMINHDHRFHVEDKARDGEEALEFLRKKKYDAVVLDINMPKMNGLEVLKQLRKEKINAKVMVSSTDTEEGSKTALEALENGAIDCVHKPERASAIRSKDFGRTFLMTLDAVCAGHMPIEALSQRMDTIRSARTGSTPKAPIVTKGRKLIAIASSTGGPRALQSVIPRLPGNLGVPVVLVQHMPVGFTASLAERLNGMSKVKVKEAAEGDVLEPGTVYIARGGLHMHIKRTGSGGRHFIHFEDGPHREGVKPCANFMYESLRDSAFDEIICVVLTGMGADGLEGIKNLKKAKKVYVISQNADTCIVYGMPRAVEVAGLSDEVIPLDQVADEIVSELGS